jgi:RNA polymerase sigma factor (sigma-70 family)
MTNDAGQPAMAGIITLSVSQKKYIEETVKRESPRLLGFIKKHVKRIEDAEDILQDVFYQFTQNIDEINYLDKTTSWLYTVARNRIIDLFRKKKAEPMSEIGTGGDEGEVLTIEDILPDLGHTPEEESLRSVIMDEIEEALYELPEEQRDAFVMNEIEGKTFKEISEHTGEPIATLISRKRYAVLYLRERLQNLFKEIFTP